MKNLNNFYNFKNTVRHFINIEHFSFPDMFSDLNKKKAKEIVDWTIPIRFRIRKDNSYRIIQIPNILNFYYSFNYYSDIENFEHIEKLDSHSKLKPDLSTGDFCSNIYNEQINKELNLLCIYDNLIKLDIKSFYDSIYTHKIKFKGKEDILNNMNAGKTSGMIMGNYISLYFAESYLKDVSDLLEEEFNKKNIKCEFYHFSDDFYFFCNKSDNNDIKNIFCKILEKCELKINNNKEEIFTYLDYDHHHILNRYWRSIISESTKRYNDSSYNNNLYFLNQLIYKLINIPDNKNRKTFLNVFFKSRFFQKLSADKYTIEDYNFHKICYIYQFSPETILYSLDKFKSINANYFKSDIFKTFLKVNYEKSLDTLFHDEQLYYYYAIKKLNFDDILHNTKNLVINSSNQILISYYLRDRIFDEKEIEVLKSEEYKDEKYWMQNYHLILYDKKLFENLNNSIEDYLIPNNLRKSRTSPSKKYTLYLNFYKDNLDLKRSFINNIDNVSKAIKTYLELKYPNEIY